MALYHMFDGSASSTHLIESETCHEILQHVKI